MATISAEQIRRRLARNLAWPGGVDLAPPADNVWWFWTFKAAVKKRLRQSARALVMRQPRVSLFVAGLADGLHVHFKRLAGMIDNTGDKFQRTALKIRTLLKH